MNEASAEQQEMVVDMTTGVPQFNKAEGWKKPVSHKECWECREELREELGGQCWRMVYDCENSIRRLRTAVILLGVACAALSAVCVALAVKIGPYGL